MVIIAGLAATMLPAIGSAHAQMMQVKCSSNLRSVALHFQFFAEGNTALGQGDSAALGSGRFHINDFQDSLYRIDEFWDEGASATGELSARNERMLCPAGPPRLEKREGFPCGNQAIGPPTDVTLAVNMRLYRAAIEFAGHSVLAPVNSTRVRSDILNHPYVPLILDVDGEEAAARGIEPFYVAPPRSHQDDAYATGHYWMPSHRHRGRTNVAFVGGHVLSSEYPEKEGWNWGYQADVGN